jgi:hypothetical protein
LACKGCHSSYASRQRDHNGRKRLAAGKLRLSLGGLPSLTEAIAPKAQWKHHTTYFKVRKQLDNLETPIKTHRFKKSLSTQLFAYSIG